MNDQLTFQRKDEVPPGGWKYFQAETKVWIASASFSELVVRVKKHRTANNVPVGTHFEEEIEAQICSRMPAGICHRAGQPVNGVASMSLATVIRGTKTIGEWLLTGRKKVSKEEANRRAVICSSCHFNQEIEGCASCARGKLHDVVNAIIGGDKTDSDSYLRACGLCSCSLKALVWLEKDLIVKHKTTEDSEKLPAFCWQR